MTLSVQQLRDANLKEPMVLFPLRQYEELMEYLEDMEDRLVIKARTGEKNIPWEEVKKEIRRKRNKKWTK